MNTRIYEVSMDRRLANSLSALGALIGAGFLTWYFLEIRSTVSSDVRSFPAAFHSNPLLTIAFGILKALAYILFPYIAATWVYIPIRNSAAKKHVRGTLLSFSDFPTTSSLPMWARLPLLPWILSWGMPVPGRSAMKRVHLSTKEFLVPDAPGMGDALSRDGVVGSEVVFCLGAFNRVLSIDLASSHGGS